MVIVFFVFYVFVTALYIFHWVLLVFLFLGLSLCRLFCFYSVLPSSIFISTSILCLEVRLCSLSSVVLLLVLVLLSLNLLFWSFSSHFSRSSLSLILSSGYLCLSYVRLVSSHGFICLCLIYMLPFRSLLVF